MDAAPSSEALRAAVLALKAPHAAKRAPAPTSSVYGRAALAAAADVHTPSPRSSLVSRFRNVETTALMTGTTMAVVLLPDAGEVPAPLLKSLDLLVRAGATALVLGPDVPRDVPADRSRTIVVPLRGDDTLDDEWGIVALGPAKRVAFLARREPTDLWSWMLTRDPVAVHRAGSALLDRVPFLRLRVPPLS